MLVAIAIAIDLAPQKANPRLTSHRLLLELPTSSEIFLSSSTSLRFRLENINCDLTAGWMQNLVFLSMALGGHCLVNLYFRWWGVLVDIEHDIRLLHPDPPVLIDALNYDYLSFR